MGTTFNGTGNCCERRRREPVGGSGGAPRPPPPLSAPQKILKSESLKTPFLALLSHSCIKKVSKVDRSFLSFDEKSVVISCNIFS